MSEKIKYSVSNYKSALLKLDEYLQLPIVNDRDRSGIIKAFEFTFELAWKTFQKIATEEGLSAGGPKTSLKNAFQLSLIPAQEEAIWLQMLSDRNLMSHTYREMLATEVVNRIQQNYLQCLKNLLQRFTLKY